MVGIKITYLLSLLECSANFQMIPHLGGLEHALDCVLEGKVEGLGGEVTQHVGQVSCKTKEKKDE